MKSVVKEMAALDNFEDLSKDEKIDVLVQNLHLKEKLYRAEEIYNNILIAAEIDKERIWSMKAKWFLYGFVLSGLITTVICFGIHSNIL